MKGMGTPHEDQDSHQSGSLGILKDWATNQRIYTGWPMSSSTNVAEVQLRVPVGPWIIAMGGCHYSYCLTVESIPQQGWLVWSQWEMMCLSLQWFDGQTKWYPGWGSPSQRRKEGEMMRETLRWEPGEGQNLGYNKWIKRYPGRNNNLGHRNKFSIK